MRKYKKRTVLILCMSALFVVGVAAYVSTYMYFQTSTTVEISQKFKNTVSNISEEYFFKEYRSYETPPTRAETIKYFDRYASSLCPSLDVAYKEMIGKEIYGQENIYKFNEDLNALFRAQGAYVLPLRITDGKVEGVYSPANRVDANIKPVELLWDKKFPESNINGPLNIFSRRTGTELIHIISEYNRFIHNKHGTTLGIVRYPDARKMLVDENNYYNISYSFDVELNQSYVFVYHEDKDDVTKETLFLYLDFPIRLHSDVFGKFKKLTIGTASPNVECYPVSIAKIKEFGEKETYANNVDLKRQYSRYLEHPHEMISMLTEPEPLTYPLNKTYPYYGSHGNPYQISSNEIVEPSLRCWAYALGYDSDASPEGCVNTEYAEHFMEFMNKDICIGYIEVKKAIPLSYPYYYTPAYKNHAYMRVKYKGKYVLTNSAPYANNQFPFSHYRCKEQFEVKNDQ